MLKTSGADCLLYWKYYTQNHIDTTVRESVILFTYKEQNIISISVLFFDIKQSK